MTEHALPVEPSRPPALRALLLVLLYSLPIFVTIRLVTDLDIWWHLREGQWIVEHQTVPVTDPFSSYGTGEKGGIQTLNCSAPGS